MNDLIIETKNLSKVYKTKNNTQVFALKDINLEIKKGELISIMGPSGAGKTTLFNMIGLLDKPDYGIIIMNGYNVNDMKIDEKAMFRNQRIGFVFQHFFLIPNLTAFENVLMPVILDNKSADREKRRKINDLFEAYGLSEKKDRYPNELSGGEQQRIALIRSMVNDPDVVLADEPTGSLDSKNAEIVFSMLKDLHQKKGKTVIFITHNKDLSSHAERIIYLEDGGMKYNEKNEN